MRLVTLTPIREAVVRADASVLGTGKNQPMAAREPGALLHVESRPRGRWIVRRDDGVEPVSEHDDAGEATESAVARAGSEGAAKVLVHDLYSRVHPVTALRSGGTSGTCSDR